MVSLSLSWRDVEGLNLLKDKAAALVCLIIKKINKNERHLLPYHERMTRIGWCVRAECHLVILATSLSFFCNWEREKDFKSPSDLQQSENHQFY